MPGKFDLKKTRSGKFMFNLKASNGEIILTSQQYTSKRAAQNGIASVQKNSADEGRFEVRTARNGKEYFVLKASNGKIIGQSEQYETTRARKGGMRSVTRNAGNAKINDET